MIFVIFWAIGLIVGIITTIFNPAYRDLISISSNLLFYQLTITISLTGIQGFLGHVFKSDMISDLIGWPKGSPFQKELGFAELGYGIAGILCIWFGNYFWLALIIVIAPLFIGAAYIHFEEIRKQNNWNSGNAVSILPDLLIPLSLIALSITSHLWS